VEVVALGGEVHRRWTTMEAAAQPWYWAATAAGEGAGKEAFSWMRQRCITSYHHLLITGLRCMLVLRVVEVLAGVRMQPSARAGCLRLSCALTLQQRPNQATCATAGGCVTAGVGRVGCWAVERVEGVVWVAMRVCMDCWEEGWVQ